MGIGKYAVQSIVDLLTNNIEQITYEPPWDNHVESADQILQYSQNILKSHFHPSVDQVENVIKPFKVEVVSTAAEWKDAQQRSGEILQEHIGRLENELNDIKRSLRRRTLRAAIKRVEEIDKAGLKNDDGDNRFSKIQLEQARNALVLSSSIKTIQNRIQASRSYQCSSPNPSCCPEIQMIVISEKIANQAMTFIQIELLNEYFFQLPRDVDENMYYSLTRPKIVKFAKENLAICKHLEMQEKKNTLELVLKKLHGVGKRE
jgi:hypothetical protein